MVHLIDKSALVAEVEKVIDEPAPSHDQQCPWEDGYYCGLDKIESIIDTLEVKEVQEEPVSEDLEKAAVEAFKQIVGTNKNSFLEIFKAGAKWKEKQMMKNAVDAKIGSRVEGIIYNVDFNIDSNLEPNDKVKVIIIKSE